MPPAIPAQPADAAPSSPGVDIDTAKIAAIQTALLTWFAANKRDLPWRHTRDPYRILVSEVMLQQIQVSRAIPFYLAFLDRFPTIKALAAAPLADAIRVWGDLGRYKRVVNLHRTARHIVNELGGVFPRDPDTLRRLPGVGPYTAGAIACFAFEDDTAFVDTNMRRVLHRLFVGVDIPIPTASDAALLRLAEAAVPPGNGWSWNQGLMEFGALHCTARNPRCGTCPFRSNCRANPVIVEAIAEHRRASRTSAKPPFRYEDSNRFYRGRVLARLRDVAASEDADRGIPLQELGTQLRPGFGTGDVSWIYGVVESLTKDGLATIAEDRPAYDVSESAGGDVRVKLP